MAVAHDVLYADVAVIIDDNHPTPPGVTIAEAARALGISREAIRQRLRRGTLPATKVNGQWYIHLDQATHHEPESTASATPEPTPTGDTRLTDPPDGSADGVGYTRLVTHLEQEITFMREELQRKDELLRLEQETRRREVSELHVLLQRAQAQIPLPVAAAQPIAAPPAEPVEHRRRWWWPW